MRGGAGAAPGHGTACPRRQLAEGTDGLENVLLDAGRRSRRICVKGYLEQFGVPCLVDSARFGMKPLTFGALGEDARCWCATTGLHVAQGLIRGRERAAPGDCA